MMVATTWFFDYLILLLTATILFWAGQKDLRELKIPNQIIAALVALFFIHAALRGAWTELYLNLGSAFLVFIPAAILYSRRKMGGGDVKILAVAFLWAGFQGALLLSILILIFVCMHTIVAKFGWSGDRIQGQLRIPFAPSVAAALICVLFLLTVTT